MTKFDYKAIAFFLLGALIGCGIHEAIHRILDKVGV